MGLFEAPCENPTRSERGKRRAWPEPPAQTCRKGIVTLHGAMPRRWRALRGVALAGALLFVSLHQTVAAHSDEETRIDVGGVHMQQRDGNGHLGISFGSLASQDP